MSDEDYERYRRETEYWTAPKLIALLFGTLALAIAALQVMARI